MPAPPTPRSGGRHRSARHFRQASSGYGHGSRSARRYRRLLWGSGVLRALRSSREARLDTSPADPQATALHRIVREHLETFLARRAEEDAPMPAFVVDELRGYLRCGVLAHGAVRFACRACGHDRLVGLSCKGRGFCPRCLGRRMTETARHWVRAVLPCVRIRQWVLSLPFGLRVPLAFHHDLALAGLGAAARAIEGF